MAKQEAEVSKSPSEEVIHWVGEIATAKKREKDYRKDGEEVIDIYSGKKWESTPFNILFSNVETLLPALFSQTPRPIVKRRFDDADPIGLAASKAGERMLKYLLDTNVEGYETFDESIANATLDALLPGRGITSIKYDSEVTDVTDDDDSIPVVQWEQVCTDSRSWNKVYFGYAKKWSKVPWIAYEDYLDEEECEKMFGTDVAGNILFTEGEEDDDDENKKSKIEDNKGSRKTALVYQIWDRLGGNKIRYISPAYNDGYLKVDEDHLQLTGFFNCPRPIQFIKKSNDLLPVAMYKLYENQAKELNTLTIRIQSITKAIKARGAYDGALGDVMEKIMDEDDNALVPTDKGSSLIDGGLAKGIWMLPIEQMIVVLQQLIAAREACKRTIYEITGISDILRGQSMASETLGAQKIKESWGTLRLKRLQMEVQRYARDVLRIMLEVAASKLSEQTWAQATGLPYPTAQQKMQAQQVLQAMQVQQGQMQQVPGQPLQPPQQPPPEVVQAAQSPSWSEIIDVLKTDQQRSYKIDIETNSTIDVEATEDQKNIGDFMNAMGQLMAGLSPMVENGSMPFEASKAILLEVVRKYRFGPEVEEQFQNMKAPQPPADPAAEKMKAEMQQAQQDSQIAAQQAQQDNQLAMQKMQQEAQQAQQQLQADMQSQMMQLKADQMIAMAELQAKKESEMAILQMKSESDAQKLAATRSSDQMKADIQRDTALKTAALQGAVQIEIAKINAATQEKTAAMSEAGKMEAESANMESSNQHGDMMKSVIETQNKLLETLANKPPVEIERNKMGQAIRLVPKG